MRTKNIFHLFAAFGTLLSLNCYAVDGTSTMPEPRPIEGRSEKKPHVGIVAGATDPEGSTGTQGAFGIDIGYQPYFPLGVALELTHTNTRSLERTLALGKATYNFGGAKPVIRHSYVGVALGADFERGGTYVASGPLLGFDIPLREAGSKFVTVGANARYLVFSRGGADAATTLNGVIKYWY